MRVISEMKNDKVQHLNINAENAGLRRNLAIAGDFILLLVAVSCALGAFIGAFGFTVLPFVLVLVWSGVALAACILVYFKRVKWILFLLIPIAVLFIWRFHDVADAFRWVVFFITNDFSTWFYVPVLFENAEASVAGLTLFFALVGAIYTLPLSIAICLRQSLLLTILFTAPFVLILFMHVYIPFQPLFLVGLLLVYFALLFSTSISKRQARQGYSRFIALALAVILLGGALIIAPQQGFTRNRVVVALDIYVRDLATQIGLIRTKTGIGWPYTHSGIWSFDTRNIGISEAGTRVIADVSLLEVTASEAGIYYIRGYSMQRFDEGAWTVKSDDSLLPETPLISEIPSQIAEVYHRLNPDSVVSNVSMSISRTGDRTQNVVYIPYYSVAHSYTPLRGDFTFFHAERSIPELYSLLPADSLPRFDTSGYSAWVHSQNTYLQINESTADGLRQIAADADIHPTADRAIIASQVSLFFSSFGQYTLSPMLVPDDADFALYFLQQSQHGYCIHYATAATLMLRALDVPARFTVGFVATINFDDINQPVEVTDGNAHAWVEVFYDEYGWLPLEVTPPAEFGTGFFLGSPQEDAMPLPFAEVRDWFGVDDDGPWADDYGPFWDAPGDALLDEQSSWRENMLPVTALFLAAFAAALFIRSIIILIVRRKRLAQADTNAAVIYAWGYLTRLAGSQRKYLLTDTIKEIALKACFSQHRLSEEERDIVVRYVRRVSDEVYEQSGKLRRLVLKLVLCKV